MYLRLSDAIVLGDTLRERLATVYLQKNDSGYCGCAIGGAMLAAGYDDADMVNEVWPWLKEQSVKRPGFVEGSWTNDQEISMQFGNVCWNVQTLEQLAGYVRGIEPSEPVQKMDETPAYQTEEVFA